MTPRTGSISSARRPEWCSRLLHHVSSYQLTDSLPEAIRTVLPSIEELEQELSEIRE
jgi:hypothetical protein